MRGWEVELTDTTLEDAKASFPPTRERNSVQLGTLGRESRRREALELDQAPFVSRRKLAGL